jgi:hypothetical protein
VELIHRLWLDVSQQPGNEDVHHKDIVTYALVRLQSDLSGPYRQSVIKHLGKPPMNR